MVNSGESVQCEDNKEYPLFFLESMMPFSLEQNSSTYCGALLSLRHIIPNLSKEQQDEVVMRGSFGVTHHQKEQLNDDTYEREEKQLLWVR